MPEITPEPLPPSAYSAVVNRIETKAMQTLMGMVTGIVADAMLHDLEVRLLSTWLAEQASAAEHWPGCAIAAQVRRVLADGTIAEAERAHVLDVLREMANTDFALTGSASSEPLGLPIDDAGPVTMRDAGIAHTGMFVYGTRAACERLSLAMGAMPVDNVSRRTDILVIGTRVSPGWVNESYGRKILKAVALRDAGRPIRIISERRWFELARAAGVVA